MSNKIKALILLPLLSIFLTACILEDVPIIGDYLFPGPTAGPVTLNVWGLWEDPSVMQALAAKYQETHPNVTINYEDRSVMELIDYKERVFERAGDANPGADIIMVHNSWVPALSSSLFPMPGSVMSISEYQTRFYPVAADSAVMGGNIYAVPAYYDGLVLVYNKAHFSEIGQQFPPTAWEEFRRLALELTIRGGDRGETLLRGGAAIGTANNIDHFSDILGLMWTQAAVDIPEEISTKPAYDALSYYTNFALEDKVWSDDMPEASAAFARGEVSMIFVPSWQILELVKNMPNITDIGVAPVPQAIPESPAAWATFWMYAVPGNADYSRDAWDFIKFVSDDEQQLMIYDAASRLRAFGSPYSSVALGDRVTNPLIQPVIRTASFAESEEIASRSGNRRQVTALQKAVNDVLYDRVTSEEALLEAIAEINR
jgi:multiple sugar transport system substrate-binding protein